MGLRLRLWLRLWLRLSGREKDGLEVDQSGWMDAAGVGEVVPTGERGGRE